MLHYSQTRAGGPAILFLHAGGYDGRMWEPVIQYLSDFHCITVDLPGHGRSKSVPMTRFSEAADAVAEVVRAIGCKSIHVAGFSMGAYIGFRYLLQHSSLADRAVLSGLQVQSISVSTPARAMIYLSSRLMSLKFLREKMAKSMGVEDPSLISQPDGSANCSSQTIHRVLNLALGFEAEADLPHILAKTLVLAGSTEHPSIKNSLSLFDNRLPHGASRIVPDRGHAWIAQDPGLFAHTLRAWLTDAPLPQELLEL